jgi:hypothetical protein
MAHFLNKSRDSVHFGQSVRKPCLLGHRFWLGTNSEKALTNLGEKGLSRFWDKKKTSSEIQQDGTKSTHGLRLPKCCRKKAFNEFLVTEDSSLEILHQLGAGSIHHSGKDQRENRPSANPLQITSRLYEITFIPLQPVFEAVESCCV